MSSLTKKSEGALCHHGIPIRCFQCSEDRRLKVSDLTSFTDLELLIELINRNDMGEAPQVTKRHGEHHESIIAIGSDHVAYVTLTEDSRHELYGCDITEYHKRRHP